MGANGDASTMVISSVHDPRGVPHADAPVIPDLPLSVIKARGSSVPLFAIQVTYPRPAVRTVSRSRRET